MLDDVAEHRDQTAVRIVDPSRVEPRVHARSRALVVHPEIQHRVHLPRHARRRPRSNAQQQRRRAHQRAPRSKHRPLRRLLDERDAVQNFFPELPTHEVHSRRLVPLAAPRRDGETRRHAQTQSRHLRQSAALAPEERLHVLVACARAASVSRSSRRATRATRQSLGRPDARRPRTVRATALEREDHRVLRDRARRRRAQPAQTAARASTPARDARRASRHRAVSSNSSRPLARVSSARAVVVSARVSRRRGAAASRTSARSRARAIEAVDAGARARMRRASRAS